MKLSKVLNFFHKASSYLAVGAAVSAQAAAVSVGVTTWPGLLIALAGLVAAPAVLGNVVGADKPVAPSASEE